MSIKIDHTISCDYQLWSISIDKYRKYEKLYMAGDKTTVAEHRLMKQDWLCQDFILPILRCNWNVE